MRQPDTIESHWAIRESGNVIHLVLSWHASGTSYASFELLNVADSRFEHISGTTVSFGSRKDPWDFIDRMLSGDWANQIILTGSNNNIAVSIAREYLAETQSV